MPTATVRVQGDLATGPRRATLSCDGVGTLTLPWWPSDFELSGLAPAYTQQNRPGRAPLLLRETDTLPAIRMTFTLGTSPEVSADAEASLLSKMAKAKQPTTLTLASRGRGKFRITELSMVEADWTSAGATSLYEVDMTLTRISDAALPIGPVKGKKPKK